MKFSKASDITQVVQQMKLFDLPRSTNRALIDNLFNGLPPFTPAEAKQERINVNVNFLESTKIASDARRQFSNAFLSSDVFFNVRLDHGDRHKRNEWSHLITSGINRIMKHSRHYRETLRSVFAQLVLHGIGPAVWNDNERWVPDMMLVGDVLLPSRTLLTLENLSYFGVFRRYTADQLWKMTHGPSVDPGWNVELAEKCVTWAREQYGQTQSSQDLVWSPEKVAEDFKSDGGIYATDCIPTIACWDFFYYNDSGKEHGWSRRIVLDVPTSNQVDATDAIANSNSTDVASVMRKDGRPNPEFLYDSKNRKYASKIDEIIHFQFADGSAVAPFRYHSVRSLGYLLYSVCHLQNRLRCKFTEHVFENLLQYFRIVNPDDAERVTKMDLLNLGIIPDGVAMIPQTERWQVNATVLQMAMTLNRQTMQDNSSSFTQDYNYSNENKPEKTATEVMAEVNAASALTGAMLSEAYGYQNFQYREICRRFCIPNSRDQDVRKFRVEMLKAGLPEEMLNVDMWNVTAERVMGGGNKQLEIAQATMLMERINLYDPDSQRAILRDYTFAVTSDPARTQILVPEQKTAVNDSVHDAQLSSAALLQGLMVGFKQGVNHGEYAGAELAAMAMALQKIEQHGGMATPDELTGIQLLAGQTVDGQTIQNNGILNHISRLAEDKANNALVKELGDDLGKLMNLVKGHAQRMQEQQQAPGEAGGNGNGEVQAKIAARVIEANAKADIAKVMAESKLKQKQEMFDQRQAQNREQHELNMAKALREAEISTEAEDILTAAEIRRKGLDNTLTSGGAQPKNDQK